MTSITETKYFLKDYFGWQSKYNKMEVKNVSETEDGTFRVELIDPLGDHHIKRELYNIKPENLLKEEPYDFSKILKRQLKIANCPYNKYAGENKYFDLTIDESYQGNVFDEFDA